MTDSQQVAEATAKTGKTIDDFKILAQLKGLWLESDLLHWLKSEFELDHGHATTITHLILPDHASDFVDKNIQAAHFKGVQADWLPAFCELASKLRHFGSDFTMVSSKHWIHLQRDGQEFGVIKVDPQSMNIGFNLPDAPFDSTFAEAGAWHPQMTHRVNIVLQQQIGDELIKRLRLAYDRAS